MLITPLLADFLADPESRDVNQILTRATRELWVVIGRLIGRLWKIKNKLKQAIVIHCI
jgi:hypothetical protein